MKNMPSCSKQATRMFDTSKTTTLPIAREIANIYVLSEVNSHGLLIC
jgi:hypothetical protein